MRYEVLLHPGRGSATVSRTVPPRCTVAFAHEPVGWLCAGLLWFESTPGATQIEDILVEAREAVARAADAPPPASRLDAPCPSSPLTIAS